MSAGADIKKRLLLLTGDVLIAGLSILAACLVRFGPDFRFATLAEKPVLLLVLVMYPASFYLFGLYDIRRRFLLTHNLVLFVSALASVAAVTILITYLFPYSIGRGIFALSLVFVTMLSLLWRIIYDNVHTMAFPARNLLILGTGEGLPELIGLIGNGGDFRVAGILSGDGADGAAVGAPHLGGFEALDLVVERENISDILIAGDGKLDYATKRSLVEQRMLGRRIFDTASFFEHAFQKLPIRVLDDEWFIKAPGFENIIGPWYRNIRRAADIVLSLLLLTIALPLVALIIVLHMLLDRGPVFYVQERLGLNRKPFRLVKFRTMVMDAETGPPRWAEENDGRVTSLGRVLRKTRLDELPQLFNVLKGDMGLIGPRPEREHFVRILGETIPFYSLRFFVKPGLTGWAQVNFPYGGTAEDAVEKLRYELYYIKNMSPFLDLRILLKTARVCLFGMGGR